MCRRSAVLPPTSQRLRLDARDFRTLFEQQGPSLGLWRAAEIAALRARAYERPVLDLGCGDGLVTSRVLPFIDIGLDPDAAALARAHRRLVYGRFVNAPMEQARLPARSVGTVISNSVLEHLPRLDEVLSATARVLRRGGRLVFTVPTEAFSQWLTLPLGRYVRWRNRRLCHLNLWPVPRWAWHLERAGFTVEAVQPYLRRPLVTAWDLLELLQQVWIGQHRLFGLWWRRLPPALMARLAAKAARLDLAAPPPGGGRLIVARKL